MNLPDNPDGHSVSDHTAYIGLGTNLGDTRATLEAAIRTVSGHGNVTQHAVSRLYRSAPVKAFGPDFLNAVMRIQTRLDPLTLLRWLQKVEQQHGRRRPFPNAPRTLDLDLILYDTVQMNTRELTLPHPRLHERAFVLTPLSELCADLTIPGRGKLTDLLDAVSNQRVTPLSCGESSNTGIGD